MFDVVVLGGGPAGVTAALRARELGATVALIERGRMGGICTNDGCAPTRVLAKTARLIRDSRQFADYGLFFDTEPRLDFEQVIARTQQVIDQLQEKKQLIDHLTDVGIRVYAEAGNASFVDPHTIQMAGTGETIQGKTIIVCVGGASRKLPIPGGEHALTHSDVWTMKTQPQSVAIIGGGATGCQLASIFNDFGTQVTLMDIGPQILISEDELVAKTVADTFQQNGIDVLTGVGGVDRIELIAGGQRLIYTDADETEHALDVEAVIMAVGWPGNIDSLNPEAAGIDRDRSYIYVNDALQTSVPHIYAAGDITGRMMLVQAAGQQARLAVENALLHMEAPYENNLVPHGGFTDPEYGSVGMTEKQARAATDCAVAVVPYADLDRAVIDGRTVGFCKLIVDRDTLLVIGAHVVGEQAVEVVQMVAAGMASGLTVNQLADLELAYPTFAAIVGLAARQLVRELNVVPVMPEWRALAPLRVTEWERLDT